MRFFFVLALIFTFSNNTFAGVSDAQRRVIDNQLFLLKEGMVTSEKVFEKAKKSEQSFKSRGDPSGKSTKNKIKFTFNSGDEIQLVCSDWEENLRIKNNWGEGLSVIITTNGVLNWLRGV